MNWTPVNAYLAGLGLPELPREAAERFEIYARRLIEENEKYNLTAVTDPDEVAVRHFADSLTPAAYLPQDARRLIDVGCGAGFPGLPLKIYLDAIRGETHTLTMLDATGKKTEFLRMMCEEMGVSGGEPLQGRAEELGHDPARRERYDVVLSRAVASMDKLDELCLPLCRVGGVFLALKSAAGREECEKAASGLVKLGASAPEFFPYQLPGDQPESLAVRIRKCKPTPAAYPRAFGAIKKRPL